MEITTHGEEKDEIWWKEIEKKIDFVYRKIIKNKGKKLKVLDLGCGDGVNIFRLNEINSQAEYIGIDFDKERIESANKNVKKHNLKNIKFIHKDVVKEEIKINNLDLIISSEVFEHFYDEEKIKVMNNISKILKLNGHLLITTPTPNSFFRLAYESHCWPIRKLVNFVFKNNYKDRILDDFKYHRYHHVGVCDKKYYQKLAYRKGFVLIKTWPSAVFQSKKFNSTIKKIMNFVFIKINPFAELFSSSIIYLYKKKKEDIIEF